MAEEQQAAPQKSGFDIKYLIAGIILIVLVAAVSFGVAYLVSSKNSTAKAPPKETKSLTEELGYTLDLGEPFTVNVSGATNRYLSIKLMFIMSDEKALEEAEKAMPLLQHTTLLVLRSKNLDALTDVQAQEKIGEELKTSVNKYLKKGKIQKVLVTKYLLQ